MLASLTRSDYRDLLALARRHARNAAEAEDLLHEALIVALATGAKQPASARPWLAGVMRNMARMQARTGTRRRLRERRFAALSADRTGSDTSSMPDLSGLSPALRVVALLALSGHSRAEIRYLLRLGDEALRQRIAGVRRHLRTAGEGTPEGLPALNGPLAFGAIRRGLLPMAARGKAFLASHDPDGHPIAFAVLPGRDSRKGDRRQQAGACSHKE